MAELRTELFWDLHLHGVAGIDFMHAKPEAMAFACETLGKNGIGFFSPTLLTAESSLLLEACGRWGAFLERARKPGYLTRTAGLPIGLHLEGPFLSPEMAGAHPRKWLARPDLTLAEALFSAARGALAIMTLAPELPGAPALIRWLSRRGVRAQLGHTHAGEHEVAAAVRAGATGVTHLFNAMRVHHRFPGVLSALRRGQLTAELITDGAHLAPDYALWCLEASPSQVYAVSDGCSAIRAPRGAKLTLGSLRLKRQGAVAVVTPGGTLAGGATFLTQHPGILAKACSKGTGPLSKASGASKALLAPFFSIQKRLFPQSARLARRLGRPDFNVFEADTLRYVGRQKGRSHN